MSIEPDDIQAKDSQQHDAEAKSAQQQPQQHDAEAKSAQQQPQQQPQQSASEPAPTPDEAKRPDAPTTEQPANPSMPTPDPAAPAGAPANVPAGAPYPGDFGSSYTMPTAFPPAPSIEQPWYGVSFGDAIERAFHKYFVFQGRASRGEFWWFYLASFVAGLVVGWIPLLGWVAQLFVSLPLLSLGWRRMHDTGKPGWWSLVLPLVGVMVTGIGTIMSIALGERDMWGDIVGPSWPMFLGSILLGIACFGLWVYLLAKPSDVRPNRYDLPLGAPVSGAFGTNRPTVPSDGYALGTPAPMPAGFQPASQTIYPAAGQVAASHPAPGYAAPTYAASSYAPPAPGVFANGQPAAAVAQPSAPAPDPVLMELSNAATAPARLQEIAAMVPTHPEYKAGLLAHPNLYPALRTWLEQL